MNRRTRLFFLIVGLVAVLPCLATKQNVELAAIKEKIESNLAKLRYCEFVLSKNELIDGKWKYGKSKVKNDVLNGQTEIRTIEPRADILVYFPIGKQQDAHIKLDFFPYISSDFSPYNALLLRDQHHPISHVNQTYFGKLILSFINACAGHKAQYEINYYQEKHQVEVDLQPIENPLETKKLKSDISLIQLADSLCVNPYLLSESNNNLAYHHQFKKGDLVKTHQYYADRAKILFLEDNFVPLSIVFYYKNEPFEEYRFSEFKATFNEE
ncbi:MAG: hypothetical protein ACPGLV_06700 [Bacteroidia bacterium]